MRIIGFFFVALGACTFPEVTITVEDGAGAAGGGGASGTGGNGATTSSMATVSSTSTGGGGQGGSGGGAPCTTDLDGKDGISVACGGPDCDDDDDGVDSELCMGGTDCHDGDVRARPGGTFQATPRPDGSFDFDCDRMQTPEFQTGCGACVVGGKVFEFDGDIGCGNPGAVRDCFALGQCTGTAGIASNLRCK